MTLMRVATSTSTIITSFALIRLNKNMPFAGSSTKSISSLAVSNNDQYHSNIKRILLLRHGQALHNPRAEIARENGCSFYEFLSLMREDDSFDSPLTELGENQGAQAGKLLRHTLLDIDMIVSSPLSRALRTADLVLPPCSISDSIEKRPRRVCIEELREINGSFLNAKRLCRSELEYNFPHWNFEHIPELDESWTSDLESFDECSERGYRGLIWLMQQREQNILAVGHGGLLYYTLNSHPMVVLSDKRDSLHDRSQEKKRCITKRFGNCEMREFQVRLDWDSSDSLRNEKTASYDRRNGENPRPLIIMEEITKEK